MVRFSKNKKGLKVTKVTEVHNHDPKDKMPISSTLTEEESQVAKELLDVNVEAAKVVKHLEKKYGKKVLPSKIKNLVKSVMPESWYF